MTDEDDVPERLKEVEENVWSVGRLEMNVKIPGEEALHDNGNTG